MEEYRKQLREDLTRGDRNFAMASTIGALDIAIQFRDWKMCDDIIRIMKEEGLFK